MTSNNVFKKDYSSHSTIETPCAKHPTTFCNGEGQKCSKTKSARNIPVSSSLPGQSNTMGYLMKDHVSICKYRYNALQFDHQHSPILDEEIEVEVVNLDDPVALDSQINVMEEQEENITIDLGALFLNSHEMHAAQSSRVSCDTENRSISKRIPRQSQYFKNHISLKAEQFNDRLEDRQSDMPRKVSIYENNTALNEKSRSIDSLVSAESPTGRIRADSHVHIAQPQKHSTAASISGGSPRPAPSSSHEQISEKRSSRKDGPQSQKIDTGAPEKRRSIINICRGIFRKRKTHMNNGQTSVNNYESNTGPGTEAEIQLTTTSATVSSNKDQEKIWYLKCLFSCLRQQRSKKSMESKEQRATTPNKEGLELDIDDALPVNNPIDMLLSPLKLEKSEDISKELGRVASLQRDGQLNDQHQSWPISPIYLPDKTSAIEDNITMASRSELKETESTKIVAVTSQLDLEAEGKDIGVSGSPVTTSTTGTGSMSDTFVNTFRTVGRCQQQTLGAIAIDRPNSFGTYMPASNFVDVRSQKRASTTDNIALIKGRALQSEWHNTGHGQGPDRQESADHGSALRVQTDLGVDNNIRSMGDNNKTNRGKNAFGPRLSKIFSERLSSLEIRNKPINNIMNNIRRAGNGETMVGRKERSGDRESPWGIPNDEVDDSNVNSMNNQMEKIRRAVQHGIDNVRVEKRNTHIESDDRDSNEESVPESTMPFRFGFNRVQRGIDNKEASPTDSNVEMTRDEFVDFITSSDPQNRRPKWPNVRGVKK